MFIRWIITEVIMGYHVFGPFILFAVVCSQPLFYEPQGTPQGDEPAKDWSKTSSADRRPSPNIISCPGNTTKCPDAASCCEVKATGMYYCCPFTNAKCCNTENAAFCCQQGETCSSTSGICKSKGFEFSSTDVAASSLTEPLKEVVCPGEKYKCNDGQTCCQSEGDQWKCCPIPNAVCCSDKIHCCPEGTTCDVTHRRCKKGDSFTDWVVKETAQLRQEKTEEKDINIEGDNPDKTPAGDVQDVPCGKGFICPTGSTCCPTPGQVSWKCCPYYQAVCCKDGVHCCPHGTTCNSTTKSCIHGNSWGQWVEKLLEHIKPVSNELAEKTPAEPQGVPCPATWYCLNDICCPKPGGGYGCCSVENPVCCPDGLHCCPSGQVCDSTSSHCYGDGQKMESILKEPAQSQTVSNEARVDVALQEKPFEQPQVVPCPGGQYYCQDGQVCCPIPYGGYGCCTPQYPVCCPDGLHCCPAGKVCDSTSRYCYGDGQQIDSILKEPAQQAKTSQAQTDSNEAKVDVSLQEKPLEQPKVVPCPGGQYYCQDGQVCCAIPYGGYGCCTTQNPVCCPDGLHCCPSGKVCDSTSRYCYGDGQQIDSILKEPAQQAKISQAQSQTDSNEAKVDVSLQEKPLEQPQVVPCPGGQYYCQDGQVCCSIPYGGYGCCTPQYPVCCPDGLHCCPSGKVCDSTSRYCYGDGQQIDSILKEPAQQAQTSQAQPLTDSNEAKVDVSLQEKPLEQPQVVYCPGGQYYCQDGQVCCPIPYGGYGCCTSQNPVCCPDGLHCCPSGKVCDSTSRYCYGDGQQIDSVLKEQARQAKTSQAQSQTDSNEAKDVSLQEKPLEQPQVVPCPGGQYYCQDGQVCCPIPYGGYGCCTTQNPVCCPDGLHCCPSGKVCDSTSRYCYGDGQQIDSILKEPAQQAKTSQAQSQTDSNEAKVDVSLQEKPLEQPQVVPCPGGQYYCQDGQVCCSIPYGGYGCCTPQYPVCCPDGLHCCPAGKVCDSTSRYCYGDGQQIDSILKEPAQQAKTSQAQLQTDSNEAKVDVSLQEKPLEQPQVVPCPGGQYYCQDGQVCCSIPYGGYGCCTSQYPVCCPDGLHCCPSGKVCDSTSRYCYGDGRQIDSILKEPAQQAKTSQAQLQTDSNEAKVDVSLQEKPLEQPQVVYCPGGQYYCQDGQVCCPIPYGGYGCCTSQYPVCCPDGLHCCPSGKVCDSTSRYCYGDGLQIDSVLKEQAQQVKTSQAQSQTDSNEANIDVALQEKPVEQPQVVYCPGGQYYCQDGQVCCPIPYGGYGCCTSQYPVCCPDGLHCCPAGKVCDSTSRYCYGDGQQIDSILKEPAQQARISQAQSQTDSNEAKVDVSLQEKPLEQPQVVPCPGGQYECQDGQVCCPIPYGGYGCCTPQYPVCCSDGLHCCPAGTKCDPTSRYCNAEGRRTPSLPKVPARRTDSVVCPDQSQCPTGTTCCPMSSGSYGCCPMPNAVCCSDKQHCCPHGKTCDLSTGTCKTEMLLDFLLNQPAAQITKQKAQKLQMP